MKKRMALFITIFLIVILSAPAAFAQEPVKVFYNGQKLDFDVPPSIIGDRTMVPMRVIFESMGAAVVWDDSDKTVTGVKGNSIVCLKIGSKDATVNNMPIVLDVPPVILDGRTLVPVRFISESLGATVSWDPDTRIASIFTVEAPSLKSSLYLTIREGLEGMAEEIDVSLFTRGGTTAKEMGDVFNEVVAETPGLFYVAHTGTFYWSYGTLEPAYSYSKEKVASMKEQLEGKVQEIVDSQVKPGMSDYEKELALHDYLVTHTKYDEENYRKDTLPEGAYTAYGVLIDGSGVCEGYAKAMKMLLDKAGIECVIITGEIKKGSTTESHAWNIVKLDGEYYHLDSTWDDPVPDRGSRVNYSYFNVTDEEISLTHSWQAEKYPQCAGREYNYFYKNNLTAASYDQFYNLVLEAIKGKKENIFIKVENYSPQVYNSNVVQQADRDATLLFRAEQWYWSVDEDMGIIEITDIQYSRVR